MNDAKDLEQVLVEAEDIASAVGQRPTTAHLLLAVFTVPCSAAELLRERKVDEDAILAAMTKSPREPEQLGGDLVARAREIAAGVGAPADTLHLLIAMSRLKECLAYDLLSRCGVPLAALRNTILSWYTGGRMPRHYQPVPAPPAARLMGSRAPAAAAQAPQRPGAPPLTLSDDELLPDPAEAGERSRRLAAEAAAKATAAAAANAAPGAEAPGAEPVQPAAVAAPAGPRAQLQRPAATPTPRPARPPPAALARDFDVDLHDFPNLCSIGKNLTRLALDGKLDPVIGRDREVDEVVDILGKRRGNNPVLVGEPGVGKTAIAEGVAQKLLALTRQGFPQRVVVELDMASLVAGTALRGSFSERLNGLKDEVRRAGGKVVVFIDELHTLVGAGGSGEGPQDAANELKAALARGEFPCIGATTHDEFRKFIEGDPALERRFTAVLVKEPTVPQTLEILTGLSARYSEHHQVTYEPEALQAAAALSARYVSDRFLPDKAIGIMDLAGSRCRRAGKRVVDVRAVAEVVARLAKVPEERLLLDDRERLLGLEVELSQRVIGHGDVLARVAGAIRRNYAGFSARRPMGSFLFLGPTGVGKTELARAVADVLYGSQEALIRVDMSEMSEAHGVARLVGAPPGYVGYGDGGQLTEQVRRRPASVVLLDELEKAHRDVQLLLLQVLDEGRLTDGRGRHIDFTQTIVILTTNLGGEAFAGKSGGAPMGFASGPAPAAAAASGPAGRALDSARNQLPLELWNRIDERCVFSPLERAEVAGIARLLLADSAKRLATERRIKLTAADEVIGHLLDCGGYDVALGARPMRQAIQRLVEAPLADAILRGRARDGDSLRAVLRDGQVDFDRA